MNTARVGTDVVAPKVLSFQTGNRLEPFEESEGVWILQDTGVYLNLSTMGVNGNPLSAKAKSTIHIWDDSSREFWLGNNCPVQVDVTKFANGRPEEWTLKPIEESYLDWEIPGARELGAPLINRKAPGTNWWCAFGDWAMPFVLKLARMN